MRTLTRKGGATPTGLLKESGPDWKENIRHICARFEVDAVYHANGIEVGPDDHWDKIFIRQRPSLFP